MQHLKLLLFVASFLLIWGVHVDGQVSKNGGSNDKTTITTPVTSIDVTTKLFTETSTTAVTEPSTVNTASTKTTPSTTAATSTATTSTSTTTTLSPLEKQVVEETQQILNLYPQLPYPSNPREREYNERLNALNKAYETYIKTKN